MKNKRRNVIIISIIFLTLGVFADRALFPDKQSKIDLIECRPVPGEKKQFVEFLCRDSRGDERFLMRAYLGDLLNLGGTFGPNN